MTFLDGLRTWWSNRRAMGNDDHALVTQACLHGAHGDSCDLPDHCDCECHARREVCGETFYGWSAPGEMVMDFSVPRRCNLPYPHPGSEHDWIRELDQ